MGKKVSLHSYERKKNDIVNESTIILVTRVSNGTGQYKFLGQRDRSFFLVPGQRDNGTS